MAAERGVTPGLDALARIAGVDRASFDEDPRRVLPALRAAGLELLDVALGLGAQDAEQRAAAEARRDELTAALTAAPRPPARPWRDVLLESLDRLTQAARDLPPEGRD
ncbi:hypothetical protein LRP67_19920 [Nocardioides sp. cx-169]|uniref:hypothetical protein n=1 Tax=Nocardioides sp. cx-169 TaxID=2899080 RepID=UPI001E5AEC07|nr:hypothetical protein [Nocardioides sp. cx-169]MCD4536366.1 hypothetical protein [Nocardioides sp. cx-169]